MSIGKKYKKIWYKKQYFERTLDKSKKWMGVKKPNAKAKGDFAKAFGNLGAMQNVNGGRIMQPETKCLSRYYHKTCEKGMGGTEKMQTF